MSAQTSLFPAVAHARRADPETSHLAAASVKDLTETQSRVLQCLAFPGTDDQIVTRYRDLFGHSATPQSIRSRRSELVRKGVVEWPGGYGISKNGRPSRVWRIAT